jgi:DNA-binding CsgD family transcriptional regulator
LLFLAGELDAAALLVEEVQVGTEATGSTFEPYAAMSLAALRGSEVEASALIEAIIHNVRLRGEGIGITVAEWSNAVLNNGLGRYQTALSAAERATENYDGELVFPNWGLVELIEAAVRSGSPEHGTAAMRGLSQSTRASGTDWALGVEARSRALLTDGESADPLYLEAIERLGRTWIRAELARAHLVYGEWLRRENRRIEAREQLRSAYQMLTAMGMEGFADRARGELLATGETVRKRTVDTLTDLTAQEAQIAKLARDGRTNQEIGSQLFISPRTVEWHLGNVFTKLGITSRKDLR